MIFIYIVETCAYLRLNLRAYTGLIPERERERETERERQRDRERERESTFGPGMPGTPGEPC